MPQYQVNTFYQTPSMTPKYHRCVVTAINDDEAIEKAQKICRRERRVMKIDGGDIELISSIMPVANPHVKVSLEVYRILAKHLNMRLGTYGETTATLEAFERTDHFDPSRIVTIPGWFALRILSTINLPETL